jgi:hypothetical protein
MLRTIGAVAVTALLLAAATAGAQSLFDGGDIRNNSLTGKDVRNKSLTKADFRGSVRGPRGPRGPRGTQGLQGAQGPPGPVNLGRIEHVESATVVIPAGGLGSATATCPPGYGVMSGGFSSASADGEVFSEHPFGSRTSWTVLFDNFDSLVEADLSAVALCAPAGAAATPASVDRPSRALIREAIRAQRAKH